MTNETTAYKRANRTKVLLLGVLVAALSLFTSMDVANVSPLDLFLSSVPLEQSESTLKVEARLKLEKLGLTRKLAKEIGQNVESEHNTILN